MSTVYTPSAVALTSITIPSDGDPRSVSSVNVPFEALADGVAYNQAQATTEAAARAAADTTETLARQACAAVDFRVVGTVPTSLNAGVRVHYASSTSEWYACGGEDFFISTYDPLHWPSSTDISAGALFSVATRSTVDFDVASDGSIVVANIDSAGAVDAYQERSSGGTWTKHSSAIGATWFDATVRHDGVHSLWCWAGDNGSHVAAVYTSPDRVTWTARTAPVGMPGSAKHVLATDRNGTLIWQAYQSTNVYFSKSTDGGITWSAVVTKALAFTPLAAQSTGLFVRPVWSSTSSKWMAMASNTATVKFWTSPDGATWTEEASLAPASTTCEGFHVVGSTWLALFAAGTFFFVATSQDDGSTWKKADLQIKAGGGNLVPDGVAASLERFLLFGMNGGGMFVSGAVLPPQTAVT